MTMCDCERGITTITKFLGITTPHKMLLNGIKEFNPILHI